MLLLPPLLLLLLIMSFLLRYEFAFATARTGSVTELTLWEPVQVIDGKNPSPESLMIYRTDAKLELISVSA